MILSSQTSETDAQQMLEFYKQHFAVVEIVSCMACKAMLCFECSGGDGMGLMPNEIGKYVIPIGDALLSYRVRLDEAPTGERMMGYQCGAPIPNPLYGPLNHKYQQELEDYEAQHNKDVKAARKRKESDPVYNPPQPPNVSETIPCGNDTRISDVERGLVPVGEMQVALSPFEKHNIREKIRATKHKTEFKKIGNIKQFETFQVERL